MGKGWYFVNREEEEKVYEDLKELDEKKDLIIGDPWQKFYYHDGKLYYSSTSSDGMRCNWYFTHLSNLRSFVGRGPDCYKSKEDIERANEWIKAHEKELAEDEKKYYLEIAMAALETFDENSEWTILCNGEEVKNNNLKKMTLTPSISNPNKD